MLHFILKSILLLTLVFSIPSWGNDPMDAYKQMLDNPGIPEVQKVKIREAMKKYQDHSKKMESMTTFKNIGEWYGHFKFMWEKGKGEMQSVSEKEKTNIRTKTDANYTVYENAGFEINKKFRAQLLASKRFSEKVKETNNFDNPANPYPWTVEKMFLGHISAKIIEGQRKAATTEEEKMRFAIMDKMAKHAYQVRALSNDDINFLIKEIKAYYKENEKRHIKHLNANRRVRKAGVLNFVNHVKSIKIIPPPKDNSRRAANINRDYMSAKGEIDGVYFSEPLIYKHFKVGDLQSLKRFKLKANSEIKEMMKLIKIVKSVGDLDYTIKNKKELREKVVSYKRKSLDSRSRDAFSNSNTDDLTRSEDREASKKKIKKWTEDFVKKANNKKLKVNTLYSRNQYWYGNLAAFD